MQLSAVAVRAGESGHDAEAAKLTELAGKYRKAGGQFSKVLFVDPSVAVDFATSAGAFFQELHGSSAPCPSPMTRPRRPNLRA